MAQPVSRRAEINCCTPEFKYRLNISTYGQVFWVNTKVTVCSDNKYAVNYVSNQLICTFAFYNG